MADKKGVVNFRGKEYKTVALRVSEFRTDLDCSIHNGWALQTDIVQITDNGIIMRAAIYSPDHPEIALATGFAHEVFTNTGVNSTSAMENCETSAIGRCLANAGLSGEEYCSADELANALNQQKEKAEGVKDTKLKLVPPPKVETPTAIVEGESPAETPADLPIKTLKEMASSLADAGCDIMGVEEYIAWHKMALHNITGEDKIDDITNIDALKNFITAQKEFNKSKGE